MKALQAVYDTRGPEPHTRIRCEAAELPAQVPAGMARVISRMAREVVEGVSACGELARFAVAP